MGIEQDNQEFIMNSLRSWKERALKAEAILKNIDREICQVRDLTKDEKGKSLEHWTGYGKAIMKIYKLLNNKT